MTAATQPVLDGMPVPIKECDWVLWRPCGCPAGVATGEHHPTEDDVWKGFYEGNWRAIAKAMQRGERLELMPHSRYRTDVMPLMTARCDHEVTS